MKLAGEISLTAATKAIVLTPVSQSLTPVYKVALKPAVTAASKLALSAKWAFAGKALGVALVPLHWPLLPLGVYLTYRWSKYVKDAIDLGDTVDIDHEIEEMAATENIPVDVMRTICYRTVSGAGGLAELQERHWQSRNIVRTHPATKDLSEGEQARISYAAAYVAWRRQVVWYKTYQLANPRLDRMVAESSATGLGPGGVQLAHRA